MLSTSDVRDAVVLQFKSFESQKPDLCPEFRKFYRLTRIEERVVILLSQGMSLQEIAAVREVKISTVRSSIRVISKKTNQNSQKKLIELARFEGFGPF